MESNEAVQTSETNPADFVKHEQEEIQKVAGVNHLQQRDSDSRLRQTANLNVYHVTKFFL